LDALLRDEYAIGHLTDAALLVPSLYCARELNALDAACEKLRNLRTATFLYDSARFTFTSPAATTSSSTTTPIAIVIITAGGGSSRGNWILIASIGITSASRRRAIFILVFGLALRYSVNIGARSETPVGVPRAMFRLGLHGSFLPQLAFGGRKRLPDDAYVTVSDGMT
jgi:hypothetical protein